MPPKAASSTAPPGTPGPPKSIRAPSTKWTKQEVDSLVSQLISAKANGNTSDNGFKQTVWVSIASSFTDPKKNEPRVSESKWSRLKKEYKEVKFLRESSGFGWDPVKYVPTAEPEVWAEIEKVYP